MGPGPEYQSETRKWCNLPLRPDPSNTCYPASFWGGAHLHKHSAAGAGGAHLCAWVACTCNKKICNLRSYFPKAIMQGLLMFLPSAWKNDCQLQQCWPQLPKLGSSSWHRTDYPITIYSLILLTQRLHCFTITKPPRLLIMYAIYNAHVVKSMWKRNLFTCFTTSNMFLHLSYTS